MPYGKEVGDVLSLGQEMRDMACHACGFKIQYVSLNNYWHKSQKFHLNTSPPAGAASGEGKYASPLVGI